MQPKLALNINIPCWVSLFVCLLIYWGLGCEGAHTYHDTPVAVRGSLTRFGGQTQARIGSKCPSVLSHLTRPSAETVLFFFLIYVSYLVGVKVSDPLEMD